MGNGSRTGDISSSRRKSASSVLSMPNFDSESSQKGDEDSETGLPQPLQILQPARRPGTEESKRTSSVTLSPNKISGESRKKAGNGLWRSLLPSKALSVVQRLRLRTRERMARFKSGLGSPSSTSPQCCIFSSRGGKIIGDRPHIGTFGVPQAQCNGVESKYPAACRHQQQQFVSDKWSVNG
ncbi:hypothetical protein GQ600_10916 [Phytophthora cactorum]|nr:hypothetical protein GQ600_10916 [Phytophthora cactorum]